MPWWAGPVLAAFTYVALRFIVPAILSSAGSANDLMGKSFSALFVPLSVQLAPLGAVAVLFVWGIAEGKKFVDRRRLDSQSGLDSIRHLSWAEFEELVAEAYRREGYEVKRTGDAAGDGGVDVVLKRNGQTTLVQCKHWKTRTVELPVVRDLLGAMADRKADYGLVVSYGAFTCGATTFAKENRITLIGENDLVELIRSAQKKERLGAPAAAESTSAKPADSATSANVSSREAPACPRCGSPMVQRTAKSGPNAGSRFWGCGRYPACRGTRPC
jgi:restriction system protein